MGSTRFRIPPALSSVLAALGTLQLRAVGILNRVDPLVSASNLYVVSRVSAHGRLRLRDTAVGVVTSNL